MLTHEVAIIEFLRVPKGMIDIAEHFGWDSQYTIKLINNLLNYGHIEEINKNTPDRPLYKTV